MSEQPVADCGPACQRALERLQAFLDGELPYTDVGEIRQHLEACYPCTSRATFEEQLRAIIRDGCVQRAPDGLLDRIRLRLAESDTP